MGNHELDLLRKNIDKINLQLLHLLNERAKVVKEIGEQKKLQGTRRFDPIREREVLDLITQNNDGPFKNSTIEHIFKTIFKASLELQEDDNRKALLVSRKKKQENTVVDVKGELIGNGTQTFIMGPCAVESLEQVRQVGQAMKDQGLKLMRGGAFKPRTSPYDFQGLGVEGLQILRQVADEFDLAI
ncbi:bifunctional 3-deoxy-7-phosphoheptulonate synthase/chorismate mutase, partial [Bacillus thuringiensis]|uniref:bifunctional 3-deoxy-7-phosphoheptulonate synthase/chorismate mutase n=1 Tax=Bacillus thuringiensis TaxID=1428 RepID=UPI000BFCFA66